MEELWSPDSYWGVRKSAKYLGVSEITLRKWIKTKVIKSLTVKSKRNGHEMFVIHKSELELFKKRIMPSVYRMKCIPRSRRKKSFVERLWERVKDALQV